MTFIAKDKNYQCRKSARPTKRSLAPPSELKNGAQKFMTVKKFVKPWFALRFTDDFALSRVRIYPPRFSA